MLFYLASAKRCIQIPQLDAVIQIALTLDTHVSQSAEAGGKC